MNIGLKFRLSGKAILYLLLTAAFAYAVYAYHDQLFEVYEVLRQGLWYFLLASAVVLMLVLVNQAMLQASIFRLFGLRVDEQEMLPLYLVRRFVGVAAPSGGFSAWVPFFQFARKRSIGMGAVVAANLIYTILWYSTFFLVLFAGLLTLFAGHDLAWYQISAAITMLLIDLAMIAGLVLAWAAPDALARVMGWLGRTFEKIVALVRRQPPLTAGEFIRFATDLSGAVDEMKRAGWKQTLIPVGHAAANEVLNALILYLVGLAFGVQMSAGVLVAGYSIGTLFYIISPTPGGLGFVEGTLILALTALGVRAHNATVITLAYRGISFWLPFLLGFLSLRWFDQQTARTKEPVETPGLPVPSLPRPNDTK